MDIFRLTRTYKSARRFRDILNVFIRHGFGGFIDQIQLGRYIPFGRRIKAMGQWYAPAGTSLPARLRIVFEELGPSFVKLAQFMAERPDLVTLKYAQEFKKLQDDVPPFPLKEARAIFESETSLPINDVFSFFSDMPIAAASIAQVHSARLLDGTDVIVKVQRPGIRSTLDSDIDILQTIASLIESNIPESKFFNPTGLVSEFAKSIRRELDFRAEARNAIRFKKNFADDPDVVIPAVFEEFTTGRILVMERVDGIRIDQVTRLRAAGIEPRDVAAKGVEAYYRMVMQHGFFHADPHPGNLLVLADGRLCIVDFGIVGRLTDQLRETMGRTLVACLNRDFDTLVDYYIELGFIPDDVEEDDFRREFKADLEEIIEPLYHLSLSEMNIAEIMESIIESAMHHRMRIPTDLILIHKVLLMLESIATRLDPDFNITETANPYVRRLIAERNDPKRLLRKVTAQTLEFAEFVTVFPKQARRIVKKLIRDEIKITLDHTGLDKFIRDMDRSSNRIAFSMVLAAILVSSAIMHATQVGPTWHGMSVMGFAVFGFAAFLGIGLIISIFRSGRL